MMLHLSNKLKVQQVLRIFPLLLLFPLCLAAQSNFKPGYVVNLKGDTIRGLIDYREWDLNPKTIKFRSSPDNKESKYSAHEVSAFSVDNMADYKRFAGPITLDHTNPNLMINERDTTFRMDTVFLELLQRGKNVALYSYSDNIKIRFYIGEAPEYTPVELGYRLYYNPEIVTMTKGRTVNENTYMKQLFALAQKYLPAPDELLRDIEESGYREYYLVNIVKKINQVPKGKSRKKH